MATLFWLTGLSGAGKTTIGRELYAALKAEKPNVVMLDGDELRRVFAVSGSYSPEERLRLAMKYARLCHYLVDQGIDVVCATISLFHEVQAWNRDNVRDYFEVYVRAPMAVLTARDSKRLYQKNRDGELNNLMGVDLAYQAPKRPDLILDNDGSRSPSEQADRILETRRRLDPPRAVNAEP